MSHSLRPSTAKEYYVCKEEENQWIISALLDRLKNWNYDNLVYARKYALESISRCDTVINNKQDLKALDRIGDKMAGYIEQYQIEKEKWQISAKQYLIDAARQNSNNAIKPSQSKPTTKRKIIRTKTRNNVQYSPAPRSGPWCIMVAMTMAFNQHKQKTNDDNFIEMSKREIINKAQPFADGSLFKVNSKQNFSRWDSKKTLKNKGFIKQKGSNFDTKYILTPSGYKFGTELIREYNKNKQSEKRKQASSSYSSKGDIRSYMKFAPPPIKKRKMNNNDNDPVFPIQNIIGSHDMQIFDNLHIKYDLNQGILLNNNKYKLILVIDKMEETNCYSKHIDFYKDLRTDNKVPVMQRSLSSGDFCWILENVEDATDCYLLPFLIERKTYNDLACSLGDGRYRHQKKQMNFAVKNVLVGGRKIYLIEGNNYDGMSKYKQKGCKQAKVSTEARDEFNVYTTKSKIVTLCTLVNWTYMIRAYIDNNNDNMENAFNFNYLIKISVFEEIINVYNMQTARECFMTLLMSIDDIDYMMAYYITKKYPTLRCLYNGWKECRNKKNGEEFDERLLLHKTVSIPICKFITQQIEKKECDPDDDIMNVLKVLKEMNDNDQISKEISTKIWEEFNTAIKT